MLRIGVLNEIYSIGDNATRCRALIALRSLYPKAKIYLFATPFAAKIFARSGLFDEFVEINELKQSLAHFTNSGCVMGGA